MAFPRFHPGHRDCTAQPKRWRVLDRNCNYSRFNGGRHTPSEYSLLLCLTCKGHWRTRGDYVVELIDATPKERIS